jgi:tRNA threonylcarbamoyladenosine biosynthesis protein TsaE
MNEYKVNELSIKHYDLYRLKSEKELNELNLFEKNDNSILLIEWPKIIKKKPNSIIEIFFEYKNNYKNRCVKILS